MHIYFSGIGGTGIGPLALIAKQAGFSVSGSDKQNSQYINYLKKNSVTDIFIGQTKEQISASHSKQKIDWYVYSSAIEKENPNHPELVFCRENGIKMSKRDELLNHIIAKKNLKLLAVAGTHGKTTTTAMAIWAFKKLGLPVSYSVGAKISFGDMGFYDKDSQYFVYECDEFDRNFLAFKPHLSMISGISWDHHEIFPTQQDYNDAFVQFLGQSENNVLWREDLMRLGISAAENYLVLNETNEDIDKIGILGLYNRRDAYLVTQSLHRILDIPINILLNVLSNFPGLSRRFEKITTNLYSDYAHTPEKISGVMSVALEFLQPGQKLVIVYEPLTNRRMHHMKHLHRDAFDCASKIYWVPSYLAREDPSQTVLSPRELIADLSDSLQAVAEPAELDSELKSKIDSHLINGDLVVCLSGGGGGSLDEWMRIQFSK